MNDGFLGRWSRRKLDARESTPPADVPPVAPAVAAQDVAEVGLIAADPASAAGSAPGPQQATAVPAPSLDDVSGLTAQSDFSRFVAKGVAPDVKNAAMKKLFADPRYNVMDGLDVYIDDYSQPKPIAAAVLRQLASAKFLGLFDQEERQADEAPDGARDVADDRGSQSVAQSDPAPEVPEPPDHADTDLRLQQDDAAAGDDPGRSAG